jgi:hypothetical protein
MPPCWTLSTLDRRHRLKRGDRTSKRAVNPKPVAGDGLREPGNRISGEDPHRIGGVAPIGHAEPIETIVDENLLRFDTIWAAAGHPKAVFEMAPGNWSP